MILPETLTNIPHYTLINLPELEELTISTQYELHGDRLFIVKDNCLESIELPSSIKKVNGKEIELQELTTFAIPSNVTKLNDYCFANCKELTEIKGLEQIKEYGIGCFYWCKLNFVFSLSKNSSDSICLFFTVTCNKNFESIVLK